MAKKKPVSEIVGAQLPLVSGDAGSPRSSHSVTAPGPLSADARGGARTLADALFQALRKREGLEEDQLVWFTGEGGEIRFRCPSRGVTTIELRLARPGRIVEYESQVPSEDRIWHLMAAVQLCNDVLDAPKRKESA